MPDTVPCTFLLFSIQFFYYPISPISGRVQCEKQKFLKVPWAESNLRQNIMGFPKIWTAGGMSSKLDLQEYLPAEYRKLLPCLKLMWLLVQGYFSEVVSKLIKLGPGNCHSCILALLTRRSTGVPGLACRLGCYGLLVPTHFLHSNNNQNQEEMVSALFAFPDLIKCI